MSDEGIISNKHGVLYICIMWH